MRLWHKEKGRKTIAVENNNRINILMAIIFLLGAGILVKLFTLQVRDFDFYAARASSQQQVSNILESKRGEILIQDSVNGDNTKLYPLATNKDIALVYAVPKEIEEPEEFAKILFEVFNQKKIEVEVDEIMKDYDDDRLNKELAAVSKDLDFTEQQRREAEIRGVHSSLIKDQDYLLLKNAKRDEEIKIRKEKIMEDYLLVLNKKDDPYEPIEKKVEEDTLLNLYKVLAENEKIGAKIELKSDLTLKDGSVWHGQDDDKRKLNIKGIGFIMQGRRFYPEKNIGSQIAGFVGFSKEGERGQYGLEGFFDEELRGKRGMIKTNRDSQGNPIIIDDREYDRPTDGSDLILTINRTVQYTACSKLDEAVEKYDAKGGSIIVMDPKTGAILAMCSAPAYDPNSYTEVEDINLFNNPAIFASYEPGSIFKTITLAAALNEGKINPNTLYKDEGQVMIDGWDKPIKNSDFGTFGAHGTVDMNTVLEKSLNTGSIFAMRQIGSSVFSDYIKNFGFGEKTGIELETESAGDINNLTGKRISEIYAATASFGQGITATPLQMITSYAAIANGGILVKPYLVKEVIGSDGSRQVTSPKQIRRVISERAATLTTGMLVNVIEGGHAKLAAVKGYYVAGKTGTAQVASNSEKGYGTDTIHTFVGYTPAEDPKFVILVKLDSPRAAEWADSSTAPLFGEIAGSLLKYYQIPKERN